MDIDFKILGVGLTRTGSKSLAQALTMMGFSTVHFPSRSELFAGMHDAYVDTPVLAHLNELFDRYDNCKLIYTCRDYGNWIKSAYAFFQHPTNDKYKLEIRKKIYGNEQPTWKDLDIAYKHFHNIFSQLDDVLFLPVESKDKVRLLCEFLEVPEMTVPLTNQNYPHIA